MKFLSRLAYLSDVLRNHEKLKSFSRLQSSLEQEFLEKSYRFSTSKLHHQANLSLFRDYEYFMLKSPLNSLKRQKFKSDQKNYFLREDYFLIKFLSFPKQCQFSSLHFLAKQYLEDVIFEKHCFPSIDLFVWNLVVQISLCKIQGYQSSAGELRNFNHFFRK